MKVVLEADEKPVDLHRTPQPLAPNPTSGVPQIQQQHEDMDDLIGFLNDVPVASCRPSSSSEAERERSATAERERGVAAERLRKQQEAEAMHKKEESALQEAKLVDDEQRKVEALRREAEQRRALERARCEQEDRQRLAAALMIQSQVRALCARRVAGQLRTERLAASVMLQSAARASAARALLHRHRVEAFTRRRAARCIADCYIEYRSQWNLAPVQCPVRGGSGGSSALDGHAHLLERPLRLRSMADTRLAPETALSIDVDAAARMEAAAPSGKRTVASARSRVGQLSQQQSRQRDDVGARTLMAVSEHRDLQGAMKAVKASGGAQCATSG